MILVTGGAGYLGCHVVSQLLDAGHAVRVIDAGWFGWDGLRRMVVDHPGPCELLTHDIRVLDDAVFEDVTAACHLAGLSNDPMAEFNAQANVSINRNATLALAAQAKRCGVQRFLFASSCSVYDGLSPDRAWDEDAPVTPTALYSWAKLMAEQGLRVLADDTFQVVCLRQATLWGWSPRMRYDLVVNTMVRDALSLQTVTITAPPGTWRPFAHVQDVAGVYQRVLTLPPGVPYSCWNVVAENVEIRNVAARVVGTCQAQWQERVSLIGQRNYRVDGECLNIGYPSWHSRSVLTDLSSTSQSIRAQSFVERYHPRTRNIDWLTLHETWAQEAGIPTWLDDPIEDAAHLHDSLWTLPEVAERLKIPVSWLYDRSRRSALPGLVSLGKYRRMTEEGVRALIREGSPAPADDPPHMTTPT